MRQGSGIVWPNPGESETMPGSSPPRMKSFRSLLVLAAFCSARGQDSVVVFNEVQYHPPAGQAEWIELHNIMAVNVDLSAWRLSGV